MKELLDEALIDKKEYPIYPRLIGVVRILLGGLFLVLLIIQYEDYLLKLKEEQSSGAKFGFITGLILTVWYCIYNIIQGIKKINFSAYKNRLLIIVSFFIGLLYSISFLAYIIFFDISLFSQLIIIVVVILLVLILIDDFKTIMQINREKRIQRKTSQNI